MEQLNLFDGNVGYRFPEELLEYDPSFIDREEATKLKELLIETTDWRETSIKLYDKTVKTPRLIAWYGDAGRSYTLGGKLVNMQPWPDELWQLKQRVEQRSGGQQFNSVLLNFYRNHNDSVAWHRDKESELGNRPTIASVSLGQVRKFEFRSVNDHLKRYELPLAHGSLLLMKGTLQVDWEHRIAKSVRSMGPRINLTFRQIKAQL